MARILRVVAGIALGVLNPATTIGNCAESSAFGGIHPRVSPDGRWIALSYQGAICRLPDEGGTLTYLTRGEGFDVQPCWSPDGTKIAFINTENFYSGRLQVIRAEDGSALPMPKPVTAQGDLSFHPDGRRLLGRFSTAGTPARIGWYDLATGSVEAIQGDWQKGRALQTWRVPLGLSPDGRWIAYATHQDVPGEQEGNDGPQADLWRVPAAGGSPEKIVRFPARIYGLCWNASGEGLYVVSDFGVSHNDLWFVPLIDSLKAGHKVTSGQADEDWPSMGRDPRVVLYAENSAGATSLVRLDPTTGRQRALPMDRLDFREPSGKVRLDLKDQATGAPSTARVYLKRVGGKYHASRGALYRVSNGRMHFYGRQETELEVPAGKYELVVRRGPEHRLYQTELEVKEGETLRHPIALERWADMAADGWYSGENHIHANYGYGAWYNTPASILEQCEGEDLNVCNIMVANSDGEGVFDREFFRGQPDAKSEPRTVLYWNQEFRSTLWGHMTLVNLERLVEPIFTGFKGTTNPWDVPTNADIAERAGHQHGLVSYTHPANNVEDPYHSAYSAKGLPVDMALGRIDTLDVMGGGYEASIQLWYRLLNCGFRIPGAAGTDCFLNRIPSLPPGWGRAYVHLTNGFSYSGWIGELRAGRSFVSNGAMVELTAQDEGLGGTLRLAGPGPVRIRGKAWSQHPLEKVELVSNGRVVLTGKLADDRRSAIIDTDLALDTGGWLALRADGPAPPYHIGGRLSAHTSPIYVDMKNRPFSAAADAEYFLAWIERLEAGLRQRDRVPFDRERVAAQLAAARSVYAAIVQRATADR